MYLVTALLASSVGGSIESLVRGTVAEGLFGELVVGALVRELVLVLNVPHVTR